MERISRAILNGLFFIEDVSGGEPPMTIDDSKIRCTASCISVACLHEVDGDAELILGEVSEVSPGTSPDFDGMLATPSREIMLSTVSQEPSLKAIVPAEETRIRVWRNHPDWADKVIVAWG